MGWLAKAVDIETEKMDGFKLYFHSSPHEKSPKDHNDDKRFYSPPAYQALHLTLSGLSWVPTVTKQPGNSFNSMKKENQLV